MAGRRRHGNGNRHLVDALHRHAGLQVTGSSGVRLAHSVAVASIRHSLVCLGFVSREPAKNGLDSSFGGHRLYGGIATLHYTSMWAMRLQGTCSYSPRIVALSIVLAIAFSLIALWLTFIFRDAMGWKSRKAWGRTADGGCRFRYALHGHGRCYF